MRNRSGLRHNGEIPSRLASILAHERASSTPEVSLCIGMSICACAFHEPLTSHSRNDELPHDCNTKAGRCSQEHAAHLCCIYSNLLHTLTQFNLMIFIWKSGCAKIPMLVLAQHLVLLFFPSTLSLSFMGCSCCPLLLHLPRIFAELMCQVNL